MKLFINTGGEGKRLYPLTKEIPKPLVVIAGKTILHHLIEWAKKNEIREFVFMNGFCADKIISNFKDGSHLGVKIIHSNEPYSLGSGGPIKFAQKYIDGRFAYISGDLVCDINFKKMLDFHISKGADMTVHVHPSTHPEDSDILQTDYDGKVIKFVSKHTDHTGAGILSNSGLCIIEPKTIKLMDKEVFNFENYFYPKILEANMNLFAYNTDEFIHDMGTFERLHICEKYIETKQFLEFN